MILRLWRGVLVMTMVVITTTVLLGIFARYVLNAPLLWTDELSRMALVMMMFLGIAELFRIKHGHVGVTVLSDNARGWIGAAMRGLASLLVLGCIVGMTYGGFVLANPSRPAVSAALGVPMWMLYSVIAFSGLLSIAFIVRRWISPRPRDEGEG